MFYFRFSRTRKKGVYGRTIFHPECTQKNTKINKDKVLL